MLAAWYEAKGAARDVLRYGELPDSEPAPGEVRVRVRASGVNPTDVKARSGRPGSTALEFSRVIPHHDGAGVWTGWVRASRNAGSASGSGSMRRSGTARQYVTVPEEQAVPLPDGVDFAAGACLGIAAITAHHCLFGDGPIDGKAVLVQGAAGAVGYYAAQLARLGGARVIATVGSTVQERLLREAGITELIDRKREDVGERVVRSTGGRGVDRIVEVALGANLDADLRALAPGGTVAAYASDGDPGRPLPFRQLLWKNATIRFVLVYLVSREAHHNAVRDLSAHLAAGSLRHSIARRLPLSAIAEAHEAMEAGHLNGKLILDVP